MDIETSPSSLSKRKRKLSLESQFPSSPAKGKKNVKKNKKEKKPLPLSPLTDAIRVKCTKVCKQVDFSEWTFIASQHKMSVPSFWKDCYQKFQTPLALKLDLFLGRNHRFAKTHQYALNNAFLHSKRGTLPSFSHSVISGGFIYDIPSSPHLENHKFLNDGNEWRLVSAFDLWKLGSADYTLSEMMRPKYRRLVLDFDGELTLIETLQLLHIIYTKVLRVCFPDCPYLGDAILERRSIPLEKIRSKISGSGEEKQQEEEQHRSQSLSPKSPDLVCDAAGGTHLRLSPEIAVDEVADAEIKYAVKQVVQENFPHLPKSLIDTKLSALRCPGAYKVRPCKLCKERKKREQKAALEELQFRVSQESGSDDDNSDHDDDEDDGDDIIGKRNKKRPTTKNKKQPERESSKFALSKKKTRTSATATATATITSKSQCPLCRGTEKVTESLPYLPDLVITEFGTIDIPKSQKLWQVFCDRQHLPQEENDVGGSAINTLEKLLKTNSNFRHIYNLMPMLSVRYVSVHLNQWYTSYWEKPGMQEPDDLVKFKKNWSQNVAALAIEDTLKINRQQQQKDESRSIFSATVNLARVMNVDSSRKTGGVKGKGTDVAELRTTLLGGIRTSAMLATQRSSAAWPKESKTLKLKPELKPKPKVESKAAAAAEITPVPKHIWSTINNTKTVATSNGCIKKLKTVKNVLHKLKQGQIEILRGNPVYSAIQELFQKEPFFQKTYATWYSKVHSQISTIIRKATPKEKRLLAQERQEALRADEEVQEQMKHRKLERKNIEETLGRSNIKQIRNSIKLDEKLVQRGEKPVNLVHESWSEPFKRKEFDALPKSKRFQKWAIFPTYNIFVDNVHYCLSKMGEHQKDIWFNLQLFFVGQDEVPVFGLYQLCPCACDDKAWLCKNRFKSDPVLLVSASSANKIWPDYCRIYREAKLAYIQEHEVGHQKLKVYDRKQYVNHISARSHLVAKQQQQPAGTGTGTERSQGKVGGGGGKNNKTNKTKSSPSSINEEGRRAESDIPKRGLKLPISSGLSCLIQKLALKKRHTESMAAISTASPIVDAKIDLEARNEGSTDMKVATNEDETKETKEQKKEEKKKKKKKDQVATSFRKKHSRVPLFFQQLLRRKKKEVVTAT